eukprot:6340179-Alexandrium_andersonii.AAC.1
MAAMSVYLGTVGNNPALRKLVGPNAWTCQEKEPWVKQARWSVVVFIVHRLDPNDHIVWRGLADFGGPCNALLPDLLDEGRICIQLRSARHTA